MMQIPGNLVGRVHARAAILHPLLAMRASKLPGVPKPSTLNPWVRHHLSVQPLLSCPAGAFQAVLLAAALPQEVLLEQGQQPWKGRLMSLAPPATQPPSSPVQEQQAAGLPWHGRSG